MTFDLANLPAEMDQRDRELILELVAGISTPAEVLARYSLSVEQFAKKCKDKMFISAYNEAKRQASSDLKVHERIKMKAAFLLEDQLLPLARAAGAAGTSVSSRRDVTETLAKLADAWEPAKARKDGAAPAQQVNIQINLGDGAKPIHVETKQIPPPEFPADE